MTNLVPRARLLDDNKPKTLTEKKWIRTVSNFISLIQFHLICQMLVKFSGVESEIKFRRIVRSLRTTAELKKIRWNCPKTDKNAKNTPKSKQGDKVRNFDVFLFLFLTPK